MTFARGEEITSRAHGSNPEVAGKESVTIKLNDGAGDNDVTVNVNYYDSDTTESYDGD